MSRETFATFDKLTAAKTNAISDQTVMTFATAAARSSAIPSPVTGMVTARADNAGAPEYWNGSAWVAISAGVAQPNPWATVDPLNMITTSTSVSTTAGSWHQITANFGVNALMLSMSYGNGDNDLIVEVGTGAAASEIVRHAHRQRLPSSAASTSQVFPWGIYVPNGTRVAVRTSKNVTNFNPRFRVVTVAGGTQVESGATSSATNTTFSSSTAWFQMAASPPKAGGVEIVGFTVGGGAGAEKFRLGLGAASSEVAITGYLHCDSGPWIPPVTWPAGTRLAIQADGAPAGGAWGATVLWRESLDV